MNDRDAWLGSMVRSSSLGLQQKDNGVCLITEDGIVFAISEERLTRRKHDSDFARSMGAAQRFAETHSLRPVAAALSSCADFPGSTDTIPINDIKPTSVPSHHYAHALSAYWMSGFEPALVIVMDAGGSLLGTPQVPGEWWSAPREQTSLWIGANQQIRLRGYIHSDPYDIGFGEWWRAFTYYLGWQSHTLTGNTMALAALGDGRYLGLTPLWADLSGTFDGQVRNDPRDPITMVRGALAAAGLDNAPPPRDPAASLNSEHAALAQYLQTSFTLSLGELVKKEMLASGSHLLCLSGGVAQNCVAAGVVAEQIGHENLFVPVSCGDLGQPIGAALHAAQTAGAPWPRGGERIFLGPIYDPLRAQPDRSVVNRAAELIAEGGIVAIAQGRSEFGPRALGHRSVLCDPLDRAAVERVKSGVKMRDDFMPLAPALRSDVLKAWPELARTGTMTVAPRIPDAAAREFGYSIHADGTARLQIVEDDETMSLIIDAFEKLTGRRILINTSFNRRGAPIVESPDDAYRAFSDLDLDGLVLGPSWIER